MAGNQVSIPVIQTESDLTQVQQNVNKVLKNLYNQITDLEQLVLASEIVGEVKYANLTTDQFQDVAGTEWFLCDGQSCVGTEYSLLTGNNVVPTIVGPPNAFIKVD